MLYQSVSVLLRRALGIVGALLLLATLLVGAAIAAPTAPDAATLTLAKSTNPAGGTDFPISAVGYISSFETSLSSPRDVEIDNSGHIYVVGHKASKVEVLDMTGNPVDLWGTKGHEQQDMFRPEDIAVVDDGVDITVIVADTGNSRLQFYDNEGNYIRTVGGPGTGDGQFNGPQGVVTDPSGNIYVADTSNHRIQVLDSDGVFIRSWGSQGDGDGEFDFPAGVDMGPDGNLYVADSNNHRIQIYAADGTFIRAWGMDGNGPGEFHYPTHVSLGSDGSVFVSDTYNYRVQKLTPEGRFLTMWGSQGSGPGQFERPNGLFVAENGLVLVVDIDTSRIESYRQVTAFLDDGEEQSFDLPGANYEVTEPVEDGWEQAGVVCEGAEATEIPTGVSLSLADDVPVRCTFANESTVENGSIAVLKYHDLDLSGDNTAGDLPLAGWTFRLRDDQGQQIGDDVATDAAGTIVFTDLFPGNYQVCELLPVDWFNTEPGDQGQPITGSGGEVCGSAAVTSGLQTELSFGNVAAATLTVVKETVPTGGGPFDFTSDVAELDGNLADGQQVSATVWPGSYTVTEGDSNGQYYLSAVMCDDTDSLGDVDTRTAVFSAAPGESVTCTFTNTLKPTGDVAVHLYEDVDESGDFSTGDLPLEGWVVALRDGGGTAILDDALTDADGMAAFDELEPGDYQACQVLPVGWINTVPGDNGQPIDGADQEVCVDLLVEADLVTEVAFGNVRESVPEVFRIYLPMVTRQE